MPPQFIFDLSTVNLDAILHGPEEIDAVNPQRGLMKHIDAISYICAERGELAGYKDVRDDEFWVPGHIPGRPLLPGVIMIEAAAQLAAFYTAKIVGWTGFIGFGGVEDCKFRRQVTPGNRLYLIGKEVWRRHGRVACNLQALCEGQLAMECRIIGVRM